MKKLFLFTLTSGFLISSVFAGAMGPTAYQAEWTWVGTISVGSVWSNAGETQTFLLTPDIEKTYDSDKSSSVLFDGEVFVGVQKMLSQMMQGQLGLAVAATSNATLNGEIWDDADPKFNNYTYSYKLQHTHIAIKGKLLADMGFMVLPWVSSSLGASFNYASSFIDTPTIYEALPNPHFSSYTKTSFTYTVGAGVQKALNEHWQVGVGYEFADWGKSELGRAEGQTLNSGIPLSHFYTNGVLFNLTYIT